MLYHQLNEKIEPVQRTRILLIGLVVIVLLLLAFSSMSAVAQRGGSSSQLCQVCHGAKSGVPEAHVHEASITEENPLLLRLGDVEVVPARLPAASNTLPSMMSWLASGLSLLTLGAGAAFLRLRGN